MILPEGGRAERDLSTGTNDHRVSRARAGARHNVAGSSLPPRSDLVSDSLQDVVTETDAPPGPLWSRMKADPQYAPEHLALEAVRRLGPEAAGWAEKARTAQPGATPEALADSAIQRFTTLARISGAVSGATGLPGAVLDVGVLAWTQARMVLHVAAAYGVDPA